MNIMRVYKFLFFLLIASFITIPFFCLAQEQQKPIDEFYTLAQVIKLENIPIEEKTDGVTQVISKQQVTLKILKGKLKNQEFKLINEITTNPVNLELKQGDKILVNVEEYPDENYQIYITDFYRFNGLLLLILLFSVLLILIGGQQGFKTILSLIISILLIFLFLIPKTLAGYNPLILALIIALVVTIITLILISGFNKKTLIAILGTLGGLIIAVIISILFSKLSHLTGLSTEEARSFSFKHPEINPQGIFFASIVIGALGAVMDVAMSIASSLTEIKTANLKMSFYQLFKAGIRVGKDIMGTMTNTLIFAYVGASLPLLLLYADFGGSYFNFINFDFIADEIVRSLGGSIGLIMVIPITAFIGSFLYSRKK